MASREGLVGYFTYTHVVCFVLIILYSLYLEYDSPLIPPRLRAGRLDGGAPLLLPVVRLTHMFGYGRTEESSTTSITPIAYNTWGSRPEVDH